MYSSDFLRPEYSIDYPQLLALGFERPNEFIGVNDYLRIGDSVFNVEGGVTTSIVVQEKTNNHPEEVLRTPGGIVMANGFSEKDVIIEIMYSSTSEIFGLDNNRLVTPESRRLNKDHPEQLVSPDVSPNSLAALIAQFKRTPILPVVSNLLNATYDIWCIALESLLIQTCIDTDGTPMPNTIKATLGSKAFAYQALCPSIVDLDAAIIWPLQRWYWRQDYVVSLPGEYRILASGSVPSYPKLTPSEISQVKDNTVTAFPRYPSSSMTGDFQFSIVAKSWVDQLENLRAQYNQLQEYALSDKFRSQNNQTDRTNAATNLIDLANIIYELSQESYARMEVQDLGPDLVLTSISSQMQNNFVPLRIPNEELPVYQHMSRGDTRLVATFWATNETVLDRIQQMVRNTRDLARISRFEMISGFIGFENEIASLMGVKSVVFTDMQSSSIPGLPDNYLISIEMIAFDRTQRKIEAVQSSTNQGSTYLDQNPTTFTGETGVGVTDSNRLFWLRYQAEKNDNPSNDPSRPSNPSNGIDSIGRPVNAWFNMAYIQQAKEQMSSLELYPDLALPTWERLSTALQNSEIFSSTEQSIQYTMQKLRWTHWNKMGRFIDPDFYIDYPNQLLAKKINVLPSDASNVGSYLATAIQTLSDLDALTALHVDSSISDALKTSLFDTYPQSGLYGPDLASNSKDMSGEKGYPAGQTHLHGTINMPHHANKTTTSIFQSVFHEDAYSSVVEIGGKQYDVDHPQGGIKSADYGGNKTPKELIGKIPGYSDQYKAARIEVTGEKGAGFDPAMDLQASITAHHPIDIGSGIGDEHGRLIAMCNDTLEHDQTGRLIQAYPAYVMQLVDEGPRIGWVKIFPNFFALQSCQSIDIIEDRREASSTAIIEMMNTYGNLSSYQQLQLNFNAYSSIVNAGNTLVNKFGNTTNDYISAITGGFRNGGNVPSKQVDAVNRDLENIWEGLGDAINTFIPSQNLINNIATARRKQSGQIMLEAGVRVHLRMGYGSNGASFPVLFNGRITDIGHGERVRVVCMSDGLELDKLIPSAESETNSINRPDSGSVQSGQLGRLVDQTYEPRELICQMLNSHGQQMYDYGIWTELWNKVKTNIRSATNGGSYADNPIGIVHFGNPYLFNLWAAIGDKGVDQIDVKIVKYPQDLPSYTKSINCVVKRPLTLTQKLLDFSKKGINALGTESLFTLPNDMVKTGDILSTGNIAQKISGFAMKIVGEGATLLTQDIPVGYGETGENIYAIYTPFEMMYRELGSSSSHLGMNWLADKFGDPDIPWLPNINTSDVGFTPFSGAGLPGTHFNMYTKNKTVWDVVTTMAQYFPPYLAAVRPFEYRSTLFFGAPYFTYRYDYNRVTSSDLSNITSTEYDKYYGYPTGYKTKPFAQFHLYTSKQNLLDNDIRASDEDTYTDVIAMWYQGQGYLGGRPQPKPVHQTVDRAIAPAFKKTAIVNTDTLGFDTAPTAAAVLGSFGTAAIGYWGSKIGIPFTDINISGGMNHFIAEENIRQMARAILRDYQKLMYQGHILVLGDPSVKPNDIMYIDDDYLDISGPAGVRRVIHHFGFESGFVTSIEPDLLCEVKGQNYLTSLKTQIAGFVGTGAVTYIGARVLGAAGRRKLRRSILSFGLQTIKSNEAADKLGFVKRKIAYLVNGKTIKTVTPSFLISNVRNLLLGNITSLLSSTGKIATGVQKGLETTPTTFTELQAAIKNSISNTKIPLGDEVINETSYRQLIKDIDVNIAKSLDSAEVKALYKESIMNSLIRSTSSKGIVTYSVDLIASKAASQVIISRAITRLFESNKHLITNKQFLSFGLNAAQIPKALQAIKNIGAKTKETEEAVGVIGRLLRVGLAVSAVAQIIDPLAWVFEITTGFLWTAVSRWWDDDTSLEIMFLKYRGTELQAGLNGHQESVVLKAITGDPQLKLTTDRLEAFRQSGMFKLTPMAERVIVSANKQTQSNQPVPISIDPTINTVNGQSTVGTPNPVIPALTPPTSRYTPAEKLAIITRHGLTGLNGNGALIKDELLNHVDDRIITLLSELTRNGLYTYINAVWKGTHSTMDGSGSGTFGGHWADPGRAIDFGGVGTNPSNAIDMINTPDKGKQLISVAMAQGAFAVGLHEYIDRGMYTAGLLGSTNIFRDSTAHIHVMFS